MELNHKFLKQHNFTNAKRVQIPEILINRPVVLCRKSHHQQFSSPSGMKETELFNKEK